MSTNPYQPAIDRLTRDFSERCAEIGTDLVADLSYNFRPAVAYAQELQRVTRLLKSFGEDELAVEDAPVLIADTQPSEYRRHDWSNDEGDGCTYVHPCYQDPRVEIRFVEPSNAYDVRVNGVLAAGHHGTWLSAVEWVEATQIKSS